MVHSNNRVYPSGKTMVFPQVRPSRMFTSMSREAEDMGRPNEGKCLSCPSRQRTRSARGCGPAFHRPRDLIREQSLIHFARLRARWLSRPSKLGGDQGPAPPEKPQAALCLAIPNPVAIGEGRCGTTHGEPLGLTGSSCGWYALPVGQHPRTAVKSCSARNPRCRSFACSGRAVPFAADANTPLHRLT